VVRALDTAGITVDDVAVLPPSLDDVFFELTGRPQADQTQADEPRTDEPRTDQTEGVLL
jgi:ABC-2 type transport system ATP-binding protein